MPRTLHQRVVLAALRALSPSRAFSYIYRHRLWGGDSPSGTGSTEYCTRVVRSVVERMIRERGVRSICDVPCGDWNYMRMVDLTDIEYVGGDIVPDLVESLRAAHAGRGRRFEVMDITAAPLPRSDLVLVRDCFIHLSNRDIGRALMNIRASGSRWLLTSFWDEGVKTNADIQTGRWHRIDLRLPPFGLPEPAEIHRENYPNDPARAMGLWPVEAIPVQTV